MESGQKAAGAVGSSGGGTKPLADNQVSDWPWDEPEALCVMYSMLSGAVPRETGEAF